MIVLRSRNKPIHTLVLQGDPSVDGLRLGQLAGLHELFECVDRVVDADVQLVAEPVLLCQMPVQVRAFLLLC